MPTRDSKGRFVSGGGSSGGVVWTENTLQPGIMKAPAAMDIAISHIMEFEANEAQNFMRTNAKWTDRTANARQGLFAKAGRDGSKHVLVMYHTVPYGIWLEVRWNGRYAIVTPSLPIVGAQVMKSIAEVFHAMAAA